MSPPTATVRSQDKFIAVLDYGIGNLRSAEKAFLHLGIPARLVVDPADAAKAAGVVLPGVGAFGPCADALERSGLGSVARRAVDEGIPFFGICVGFQLMYESSVENPGARGLGIFAGEIGRLPGGVKHPQMQWNRLSTVGDGSGAGADLMASLGPTPWVYFVHSYAPDIGPRTVAICEYGGSVAAAAAEGEVFGTQFHPEKSGATGLGLLARFAERCGIEVQVA